MMSICTEFHTDHRQRAVVDGAAIEWTPIISGMPQGAGLGPLLFILYPSEMFELVEDRLFVYADEFTLLAVVRKPADLLLLPPLIRTWLGCRSGAIICA